MGGGNGFGACLGGKLDGSIPFLPKTGSIYNYDPLVYNSFSVMRSGLDVITPKTGAIRQNMPELQNTEPDATRPELQKTDSEAQRSGVLNLLLNYSKSLFSLN